MVDINNGSGIIRVEASEYRGEEGLDIRRYYLADDGEWKPTRTGIQIAMGLVVEVLAAVVEEAGL